MNTKHDYLKGDYWQEVRREVWARDRGRCVVCDQKGEDVHHLNYAYKGRELDGLQTVELRCRGCHREAHGLPHQPTWQELEAAIARMGW